MYVHAEDDLITLRHARTSKDASRMLESEVASLVASECDCAQAAVEVNRLKLALLPSRHDGEILLRYSLQSREKYHPDVVNYPESILPPHIDFRVYVIISIR
jgi:hypothetical protein